MWRIGDISRRHLEGNDVQNEQDYSPGATEVAEGSAARALGVSFNILAEVEFAMGAQGVIVSQGSRSGGYTLFVKARRLQFVYNFLGVASEQRLSCPAPSFGMHAVGVEFRNNGVRKNNETLATITLYVDGKATDSADFRTQSNHDALAGEALAVVVYHSGDRVPQQYDSNFPFTGGQVMNVMYDIRSGRA
jgi:hypothetical protein